jgi:hypothetical protein
MKLPRRNFLHLAAGAAALSAVSRIAWAQTYPTRPVRMLASSPEAVRTSRRALTRLHPASSALNAVATPRCSSRLSRSSRFRLNDALAHAPPRANKGRLSRRRVVQPLPEARKHLVSPFQKHGPHPASPASSAIAAQGPPAGSVASGMGAHRNAQPAVSFLMQSNSHVLPVQRSSTIEP